MPAIRTVARFPVRWYLAAGLWALLVLGLVHPSVTLAHAEAERTAPAAGASLSTAPAQVDIWFSEEVIPARSSVEVFDAANHQVSTGVKAVDNSHLQATLAANLPNGDYHVDWASVSADDGHTAKGTFSFAIGAAGASATVAAPAAHAAMADAAASGSSSLLDGARLIVGALALCCAGLLAIIFVRRAAR